MDFSSEVLIDFGLNLAGYVIAAFMIFVILGRRGRKMEQPAAEEKSSAERTTHNSQGKTIPVAGANGNSEFIPLSGHSERAAAVSRGKISDVVRHDTVQIVPIAHATRKENRRAIYEEAKRLLASGKPHSDLLRQLPVTEGELEMLSVSGKV